MNRQRHRGRLFVVALCTCVLLQTWLSAPASALTLTVPQSSANWLGFMNVFELPSNGGAFVFGSPWGVPDLVTDFNDAANQLRLLPNSIGDPDPFWYVGGGGPGAPGNKTMEANLYLEETGPLAGQDLTFAGEVIATSFTASHESFVFIRDFAPDFSSSVDQIAPLPASGPFSISLTTINDPARHVQYGFRTVGPNVWITDTEPFGSVVIGTVPEPAGLLGLGLALLCGWGHARRRFGAI